MTTTSRPREAATTAARHTIRPATGATTVGPWEIPGRQIDGLRDYAVRRRGWHEPYLRRIVAGDILVAAIAGALGAQWGPQAFVQQHYWTVAALGLVIWPFLIWLARGYEHRHLAVTVDEYRAVNRAALILFGLVGAVSVVINETVSRAFLLIWLPSLYALSTLLRVGLRGWLHRQRAKGLMMQRALLVGNRDAVESLALSLRRCSREGLLPIAACTEAAGQSPHRVAGLPILGDPRRASEVVEQSRADVVIVTSEPRLSGAGLRRLAWRLDSLDVELLVSTGLIDVAGPRLSIRPSEDTSLLHIERPAASRLHHIGKALMDRVLSFLLIILCSPLLLGAALAIKLDSKGPVFYTQTRIGRQGRPFRIFKFRTMVVDADKQLAKLMANNEGNTVQFKMKRDPRVTSVGQFLRTYSVDELPQLFNVLLGTMSLVGPRPQSQAEVDRYAPDDLRRLHVRPGMTGLWQVSGRSDLSWEDSIRLDLRYVDNWSPTFDLRIMLRTFRAVLAGSGAY